MCKKLSNVLFDMSFLFAGVGPPLSPERTRMLLALRINVLTKGYSGISMANLKKYIKAFNGNNFLRFM